MHATGALMTQPFIMASSHGQGTHGSVGSVGITARTFEKSDAFRNR